MSDGRRGAAPEWVFTILAAERLGCSVFELERQPAFWRKRALQLIDAMGYAERERAAHARHQH